MKKIILTSSFSTVARELFDKVILPQKTVTIGFVTTAADPYRDKPWMVADRKALVDLGYVVQDIDLKEKNDAALRVECANIDALFIAGGNAIYLAEHSRRSGFASIIRELLERGILFVGSSAGSILAGPTVEPFIDEDLSDLPKDFLLQDEKCLGLVSYIVLPHYPAYAERNDKIAEKYKDRFTFVKMRDDEYRVEEI